MRAFSDISPAVAPPHELLKPFISRYVFHDQWVPEEATLKKRLCFHPMTTLDFYIGDPFKENRQNAKKLILETRAIIRAPHSFKRCAPDFSEHFVSFSIRFQPTGFSRLLGIPMDTLGNNAIRAADIGLLPFSELVERMMYAPDISHCIRIVEPYLLHLAMRRHPDPDRIGHAGRAIIAQKGDVSINELSSSSCLSISQLERTFKQKIGVTPKDYACMQRMFQSVCRKIEDPSLKWSALACEFGYFDPIHFTREFKKYFSFNPSQFIPSDYILL